MRPEASAITGAFGYTGKYIARRLLDRGERVITLTGNPNRQNLFGTDVKAFPFHFDRPELMAEALIGTRVLYNTYWVRFNRGDVTHDRAVANTIALFRAAKLAKVQRIVHISITNPDLNSRLPYFRGKALLEREIQSSQMSNAIIRPTVIFGFEDILINNIAYLLRKMPLFVVPGSGQYRLQPVYVDDVAQIAINAADEIANIVVDAAGPEIYSFEDLVRLIGRAVGSRAKVLRLPPRVALSAARVIGAFIGDVLITKEELEGLMENLLISDSAPSATTRFSTWVSENAPTVGATYASELRRHYLTSR